jgi:hypothetical protein
VETDMLRASSASARGPVADRSRSGWEAGAK